MTEGDVAQMVEHGNASTGTSRGVNESGHKQAAYGSAYLGPDLARPF